MKKFKIGCDVDGVLANWYLAMCLKFNEHYKIVHRWDEPWLVRTYHEVIKFEKEDISNTLHFWSNLPIISHPASINFDIAYYITAIEERLKGVREVWLDDHGYPQAPVIISHKKLETCLELGVNVLIDDRLETLIRIRDNSEIIPIKFTPDYIVEPCPEGIYEIKHLSQVRTILEKL